MGLDMYLLAEKDGNYEELVYWRKHPNLHGAMENLWRSRFNPPDDEQFNCVSLYLDRNDIEFLIDLIKNNNLPLTKGFFFGKSDSERLGVDVGYFNLALEYLDKGHKIFYDSWW